MDKLLVLLLAPLLAAAAPAADALDILFFKGPGRCDALAYRERSVDAPASVCAYQGERTVCVEYSRDKTTLNGRPCKTTGTGALLCGDGGGKDARIETDFDPSTLMLSYLVYAPGRPETVVFPDPVTCRGLRFERRNRPAVKLEGA